MHSSNGELVQGELHSLYVAFGAVDNYADDFVVCIACPVDDM